MNRIYKWETEPGLSTQNRSLGENTTNVIKLIPGEGYDIASYSEEMLLL